MIDEDLVSVNSQNRDQLLLLVAYKSDSRNHRNRVRLGHICTLEEGGYSRNESGQHSARSSQLTSPSH
jgi:hypothetical protein